MWGNQCIWLFRYLSNLVSQRAAGFVSMSKLLHMFTSIWLVIKWQNYCVLSMGIHTVPSYINLYRSLLHCLIFTPCKFQTNTSCSICVYLPGLSSADGEGTTRWVVLGLSLHTAGITAMIWFCQTKATYNFSPSCRTNKHTPEIRWILALCKF